MQRLPVLALLVLATACDKASTASSSSTSMPAPAPDVWSTPDRERPIPAQLTQAPFVPAPIVRDKPAFVTVDLEVVEVEREIAPGTRYMFWTFGGQVPGKFIRVRQGDVVELRLKNHPSSKLPHNIDLHAVTGPGGGAEASLTAPGHESVFTFRALNPGLYVYHCATAPVPMHVANGMYGMILVEPPGGLPRVDREYYVMQGDFYTQGAYHAPGLQAFDLQAGIDEKPTYVVFNGGPNLVSSFHVIGEIFDRVYTEGGSRFQENVQTTLIPAGGSTIVDFTVDVPGTYALVDHAIFRAFHKGAVGQLEVTGMGNKGVFTGKQAERPYTGTAVAAAEPPADPAAMRALNAGEASYGKVCAACHQASGQGVPNAFPPLAGSDYLASASKETVIGHVLHGLQGEITVNGKPYNGVMPPLAHLPDHEIAQILSFIGSSWGNKLPAVTADEVARVRNQRASAP